MDLGAEHSVELGKCTYSGTCCWLRHDHPFKLEEMQDHFNRTRETRSKLRVVTIEEQLAHEAEYQAWKANGNREGALGDPSKVHGVKCMSILFRLPYWKVSILPRTSTLCLGDTIL